MVSVRLVWLVVYLFMGLHLGICEAVKVTVELEKKALKVGEPIQGTLQVFHQPSEEIDLKGVKVGGQPLEVTPTSSVDVNGEKKTLLKFSIPAQTQAQGLQLLPAISLKVGGTTYSTIPESYFIESAQSVVKPAPQTSQYASTADESVWLKLETFIEGKDTLFPGQRTTVGYRYYFNGNIQLDQESLPLLEAEGFKKIGDPVVKDARDKKQAVRQISQEIEAIKDGEYQFAESEVSGYVYKLGPFGQQIELGKIQAKAPTVTLKVLSFPDAGKPISFNGAMGNFTFAAKLLSLAEVSVGNKITLSLEITGTGDLENLPMPEICCQPGFSGNFRQSDIPPIGVVKGNTKSFVVDLWPLSPTIKEVPKIEFSFYNPDTKSYQTLYSEPIPLTVHPESSPVNQNGREPLSPIAPAPNSPQEIPAKEIEIRSNVPLNSSDLHDKLFGSYWTLLIIPLILGVFWLQMQLKKAYQEKQKTDTQQNSQAWLDKAYAEKQEPSKLYHALEKAFLCLLKEKKVIASEDVPYPKLPTEGVAGDVRAFLTEIEARRFAGGKEAAPEQVLEEAQRLFDDIKNHTPQFPSR